MSGRFCRRHSWKSKTGKRSASVLGLPGVICVCCFIGPKRRSAHARKKKDQGRPVYGHASHANPDDRYLPRNRNLRGCIKPRLAQFLSFYRPRIEMICQELRAGSKKQLTGIIYSLIIRLLVPAGSGAGGWYLE